MAFCELNLDDFGALQADFKSVFFRQTVAWINSRPSNVGYRFFADDLKDPSFILAGQVRKVPLLGSVFVVDGGPLVKSSFKYQEYSEFLKKLAEIFSFIEVSDESVADPNVEVEYRRAGFSRPLWLKYCPMTIYKDVRSDSCSRSWKREIKKARKANLFVEKHENISPELVSCFINAFQEMKDTKNISYIPAKNEIKALLSDASMRLYSVSDENGYLAFRVVWVSKGFSTDVYAANFNRARDVGGTHFLLDSIFKSLKEEGVELFDFGRIGPGSPYLDSVYQFKRSSGGSPVSYNGEWVFSRSILKEILLFNYRFLVQKRVRW